MRSLICKIILMTAGVALLINAIILAFVTNFNFGIIITLFFGIVILLYGIYFDKIKEKTKTGMLKWVKYCIYAGFAMLVFLISFIAVYGQVDNATYSEDAVIVLGAGIRGETVTLPLMHRLDVAADYSLKNPNAIIVVSGGQGFQETITEALAMERYLINKGVDQEKIIREEHATSTYENFVYSKALLDKTFVKPYKSVLITNDFHIYRATQISKIAGISSTHIHAKMDWYTIPLNYLRESVAVVKLWVLKR